MIVNDTLIHMSTIIFLLYSVLVKCYIYAQCIVFFSPSFFPNCDKKFGIRAIYKNFGIIVFNVMFYSNIGIELIFREKNQWLGSVVLWAG